MSQTTDHEPQAVPREYDVIGEADARSVFITRTYLHLLGAIAAFVGIEWALFSSGAASKV